MKRPTDIRSTDRVQLDSIPEGPRSPQVRYINPLPINVYLPTMQTIQKFPVLGFSMIYVGLECFYPPGATFVSQLRYEIVKHRDGISPVMLSAGNLSPFYDRMEDEYWIDCDSIELRLATPNQGTAVGRPINANYSILALV